MSGTVIIGASHSGITLADLLRKGDYNEDIYIIDKENHFPIERPPLSKSFLYDKEDFLENKILLRSEEWYQTNKIKCSFGIEVLKIDRDNNQIILSDGNSLKYKNLVLALGATPKLLPESISNYSNYYVLRSLNDAKKIRSCIKSGSHAAVIGGGYIGLEIASSLKKFGYNVDIIEMAERLLARVASPELSKYFLNLHKKNNINVFCSSAVDSIHKNEKFEILFDKNKKLNSEIVIVGIGVLPNVNLAEEAGLICRDGIIVNKNYLTSDNNIFAIGDCALNKDEFSVRIESVHNAQFSASRVASYILGVEHKGFEVPWFWSDQFDIKLQSAGLYKNGSITITRKGKREGSKSWWSFDKNKLVCIEAVNDPQSFMIARQILQKNICIEIDQIRNNNTDLKSLLKS